MSDTSVQDEPDKAAESAKPSSQPVGADKPVAGKSALSGPCQFNDSITIYSDNPLPQYDKGPLKAFVAVGRDKAPPRLFALICEDHLTPRITKALNYVSILNPGLPRLVGSGKVDWTPAGREKYCYIYENILGNRLMVDDTRGGLGLKPEFVVSAILRPTISVLQDMRDKDIVHGNIRPSNIFDGGVKNYERVVLGECLSMPPSCNQPPLYETIDRALCSPSGRGTGTIQDDIYSLGVTLAVLMRHFDPTEGLSDDEIIERKMEEGSYTTLLSRDRFSGAILELLRGLLYDDENQRWTLDDILVWMDGRRLSPKQAARRSKASRPINFNGEKYTRPELLARDLNKNVSEAKHLVDTGDMEQWLMRALEDKVVIKRFETALSLSEEDGRNSGYPESLITRLAIALNPEGPIRYKSISVHPDGIGTAFTEAFIQKRDMQSYTDFFVCYFITQWIDAQTSVVSDVSSLINKFDSVRAYIRQQGMGGGLERCVYWLNPEVHCLSEKLKKYHVRSPEDMMLAYEAMSKLPSKPALFFDRHVVAFLSVKDRKNIDPYMHDLNAPEAYKRVLGELKTLATIQKRSQMEKFPGICAWVAENLDPVYERFHDRELRVELKKKVDRLKEGGDLVKIISIFDNVQIYQDDNSNFRKSMRKHYDLERELETINHDLQEESLIGKDTGRNYGALVSAVLAVIIIIGSVAMGWNQGALF